MHQPPPLDLADPAVQIDLVQHLARETGLEFDVALQYVSDAARVIGETDPLTLEHVLYRRAVQSTLVPRGRTARLFSEASTETARVRAAGRPPLAESRDALALVMLSLSEGATEAVVGRLGDAALEILGSLDDNLTSDREFGQLLTAAVAHAHGEAKAVRARQPHARAAARRLGVFLGKLGEGLAQRGRDGEAARDRFVHDVAAGTGRRTGAVQVVRQLLSLPSRPVRAAVPEDLKGALEAHPEPWADPLLRMVEIREPYSPSVRTFATAFTATQQALATDRAQITAVSVAEREVAKVVGHALPSEVSALRAAALGVARPRPLYIKDAVDGHAPTPEQSDLARKLAALGVLGGGTPTQVGRLTVAAVQAAQIGEQALANWIQEAGPTVPDHLLRDHGIVVEALESLQSADVATLQSDKKHELTTLVRSAFSAVREVAKVQEYGADLATLRLLLHGVESAGPHAETELALLPPGGGTLLGREHAIAELHRLRPTFAAHGSVQSRVAWQRVDRMVGYAGDAATTPGDAWFEGLVDAVVRRGQPTVNPGVADRLMAMHRPPGAAHPRHNPAPGLRRDVRGTF